MTVLMETVVGAPETLDLLPDLRFAEFGRGAFVRPVATGVKCIPARSCAFCTSRARVVIAEAINDGIPDRSVSLNQQRFAERYPNVIHDKIPARKIRDIEIRRLFDGFPMFLQAIE